MSPRVSVARCGTRFCRMTRLQTDVSSSTTALTACASISVEISIRAAAARPDGSRSRRRKANPWDACIFPSLPASRARVYAPRTWPSETMTIGAFTSQPARICSRSGQELRASGPDSCAADRAGTFSAELRIF